MNINNDYESAEDHYEKKEYKKALALFTQLNSREQSNDCLNYIGCCNLKLGDYHVAIEIFERLIRQNPDWERPVFNLGRVYLKLELNAQALNCFKKAIIINPNNEDGFYYLGVFYFQAGNYKTAIMYYEKSLELVFNQPETHINLGICYFKEKLYEKALEELNVSLNLDSNDIDAMYNIGLINLILKNYKEALNMFLKLHSQCPEDIDYIMEIVSCYCKLGDFENGSKWNDKILQLQPDHEKALLEAKKIEIRRRGNLI